MKHKKKQAGAASSKVPATNSEKAKAPAKTKPKPKKRTSAKAAKPRESASEEGAPLSARHENFATLYATGTVNAEQAYLAAFGDVKGARHSASRLLTFANIKARVKEIQTASASGRTLTLRMKREYLYDVVKTPIRDVDDASELCQTHKDVQTETGGFIEKKMPDKLKAIELDARLAGELREVVEVEASDGMLELLLMIRSGNK